LNSKTTAAAKIWSDDGRTLGAVCLLLCLIGAAYAGSLNAVWTLDDLPNILHNPGIQIEDLRVPSLCGALYAPQLPDEPSKKKINRPIAYLSFALNWYLGHDSAAGFRLVNIAIHLGNACLLFLVIRRLLAAPRLRGRLNGQARAIAFCSAGLWALNPIQSQAVVYIVQRMTLLAAFFCLLATWAYLRARESPSTSAKVLFFILAAGAFLAGTASKENAVMLPAALLLIEICFFQDLRVAAGRKWLVRVGAGGLALTAAAAAGLIWTGGLSAALDYSGRLFTPWERLMTQPRVLWFYLSQIFFPLPDRFSLIHEIAVSRSLLDPWTTLPAWLGLLSAVGMGCAMIRRHPIAAFGILFFFLNHLIESSIIGLELIFEHRNYLPSLFLFFPFAAGAADALGRFRGKRALLRPAFIASAAALLLLFGAATHIRLYTWLDAKALWEDAARKAPGAMRPLHNLAYEYYEKRGRYREAYELYHRSLTLADQNRKGVAIAHSNIANYHYRNGDFLQALAHLDQAVAATPDISFFQYFRSVVMMRLGRLPEAREQVAELLQRYPEASHYRYLMARILLGIDAGEAVSFIQSLMAADPSPPAEMHALLGISLSLTGESGRAVPHLRRAALASPQDNGVRLWLIYCGLLNADFESVAEPAARFLDGLPVSRIAQAVADALGDGPMPPEGRRLLIGWLHEQAGSTRPQASAQAPN
jgi:tetratricopeptide (TPR) repeat protein